jgi:hypothetical protein
MTGRDLAQPLRLPRRDSSQRFLPSRGQDSTRVSSRQAESLRHGSIPDRIYEMIYSVRSKVALSHKVTSLY